MFLFTQNELLNNDEMDMIPWFKYNALITTWFNEKCGKENYFCVEQMNKTKLINNNNNNNKFIQRFMRKASKRFTKQVHNNIAYIKYTVNTL